MLGKAYALDIRGTLRMATRLTSLAAALIASSFVAPSIAQESIPVGPQALMGVIIGAEAEAAVTELQAAFGDGNDSGWIDGCEYNGVKERYITWGGLTAAFEETEYFENVFINWSYTLNRETYLAKLGGPTVEQIVLPKGVQLGDRYSDAAKAYGFEPVVDDVFGIGIYSGRYFEMFTASDDLNGPIIEIAVPHLSYCE